MESRTSKAFKKWMTNEDVRRLVGKGPYAQGTAEDRVTAVNNELCYFSLTTSVTVFDKEGRVVPDLKAFVAHVKAIKDYLSRGHYHAKRNKYGVEYFADFLEWLSGRTRLNTYEKVVSYLDGEDLPNESLPSGDVFKAYLLDKYGRITGNVRSIWSRVQRVLRTVPHTHGHPTFDELVAIFRNMHDYVGNADSAANCKVAIRHYMRALYGRTEI
ncbi:MAG: hypothetical protein IKC14_07250 [Kiritimatiellae bacterium]|nr:hypothetical protein [Kiritimatiellia bacterium]